MSVLQVIKPADGSRVVRNSHETVLLGQPPEVLKGLLLQKITHFDTLVLPDTKERDGSLLNNLEFPLYFFLFMGQGLQTGKKLNLVGEAEDIQRILHLLHLTLLGPSEAELASWDTPAEIRREWLAAAQYLALKDEEGRIRQVVSFFNLLPFENGVVTAGGFTIAHPAKDHFTLTWANQADEAGPADSVTIDLGEDRTIAPPYQMQSDFVPRELVKLGLEILGSASGFTANEPCTGLALCYNGDYILIDSIPYLDKHLYARGISKNQISAVFLTHLHDDHCALFPLILMPRRVDIITTRAIFEMAMEKLSCNLNWRVEVIKEYFKLIELVPGQTINYYGLDITPHLTVHSIPTIGATFTTAYRGLSRSICIIGDNHGMTSIANMVEEQVVSQSTYDTLRGIYTSRFDLLVADGGAGAIHGDPADALRSDSERVVFVHVEHLSNQFNTTFSLAASGKRYTVLDGDNGIYLSLINHYLSIWLGEPLSNRWSRSILAEEELRRYNAGDVIMVQESKSRGYIFLILTGYCDVVTFDGETPVVVASLQAGEIIGEMAAITGSGKRNASVVASSPVTVSVFSEETFRAFISAEGHRERLIKRWGLRLFLRHLPQFESLISTVLERLAHVSEELVLDSNEVTTLGGQHWYILISGRAEYLATGEILTMGDELGSRPFAETRIGEIRCLEPCHWIRLPVQHMRNFIVNIPQFNFEMRKYRLEQAGDTGNWIRGSLT